MNLPYPALLLTRTRQRTVSFVFSIARLTSLEGVRARLPWLIVAIIATALGLAQFLTQISIIEAVEIRGSVLAAGLRVAGVFIMVVFVTSSMARETSDKVTEFLLSQPMPRWAYFTGRLLGYLAIAACTGLALAIPLWIAAPLPGMLAWTLSLVCELAIMTALSIFLAFTFSQAVTAISAAAAFYLLSRSMHSLQLMAAASMDSQMTLADQSVSAILSIVAMVLPALDRFTQSSWLVSPPDMSGLLMLFGQAVLYITLISLASMFDLYRKNF